MTNNEDSIQYIMGYSGSDAPDTDTSIGIGPIFMVSGLYRFKYKPPDTTDTLMTSSID